MSGNKAKIIDGKKQCRLCKKWKDTNLFGTFLDKKKGWVAPRRYLNSRCKDCANKTSREWQRSNKQYLREKWLVKKEEMLGKIRDAYGGACSCCGEDNPLFLTIDHVNNDGYKERPYNKKVGRSHSNLFSGHYYQRIIKAGFPDTFQLLCWNCNCGRSRNGGICPHKD